MNRRRERGNTLIETALLLPVIAMLLVGMTQVAQVTYTYYTLRKAVYAVATYLSVAQGVNFCDPADPSIAAAINFGLTNPADNSPVVTGLTAEMIQVTPQSYDSAQQAIAAYGGCGTGVAAAPAFIVVSIPQGFPVQLAIPFFAVIDAIPLKPAVKVPYGGT